MLQFCCLWTVRCGPLWPEAYRPILARRTTLGLAAAVWRCVARLHGLDPPAPSPRSRMRGEGRPGAFLLRCGIVKVNQRIGDHWFRSGFQMVNCTAGLQTALPLVILRFRYFFRKLRETAYCINHIPPPPGGTDQTPPPTWTPLPPTTIQLVSPGDSMSLVPNTVSCCLLYL